MQLSADILDYIFSFLRSHKSTLIACLKDPALSSIAERHLYYQVTIKIDGRPYDSFTPDHISKLEPRILNHVRILHIDYFSSWHRLWRRNKNHPKANVDLFANTLLMFPLLESIKLTIAELEYPTGSASDRTWYWTAAFQAALEDRLNLPTVKEIHLVGGEDFPFSLFDNCKNIQKLSLSGSFQAEGHLYDFWALPQLKSLTLRIESISSSLLAQLKLHVKELESLKFVLTSAEALSELLGVCSGTLKKLEVDFADSLYCSTDEFSGEDIGTLTSPLLEVSSWAPNLQQLRIYTAVNTSYFEYMDEDGDHQVLVGLSSWLPVTAMIINIFTSAVQHLILDINIRPNVMSYGPSDLDPIDFSPLKVLGTASLTIPRIDLNVHIWNYGNIDIHAKLLSLLECYEDVMRSINAGVLVIHSESGSEDFF